MNEPAPLIVALRLDAESFARLDAWRAEHFPPAINHLRAHLTLFHQLPGDRREEVGEALAAAAARPPPRLAFTGLRSLGRGVAVEIASPELVVLRAELARRFAPHLTPQDRQGFRPHVTVQNKVSPEEARELKKRLQASFAPWQGRGEGLRLHRYLNGPWDLEAEYLFRDG